MSKVCAVSDWVACGKSKDNQSHRMTCSLIKRSISLGKKHFNVKVKLMRLNSFFYLIIYFFIGYLHNCLHWIEAWQLFLLSFQKALCELEAVSPSVWIITCNLTQTGQPATIKVDVKMPENYPVDLYYLMDLSGSMVEDLKKFPTLGQQIGTYLYSNLWTSCLI